MALKVNIQENLMELCGKVVEAAECETFKRVLNVKILLWLFISLLSLFDILRNMLISFIVK